MLSLLLLLGSAVEVVGSTSCPTAAQVSEQLSRMMPAPEAAAPRDRVHFQEIGDRVYVRLETPDGGTLAERTFGRSGDCASLALAIAVAVTAWESDLHPELSLPGQAPSPEAGEPSSSPAPARPEPQAELTESAPVEPPRHTWRPARRVGPEALWGVAASLSVGRPGGALVFGGGFDAGAARGPRWGARGFGVLPLPLRDEVGPVAVSWWRPLALAELWVSFPVSGNARFELHPGVGASLLRLSDGMTSSLGVELVTDLGARLILEGVRLAPWIGVDGLFWPTPQVLQHRETAERLKLPDWQLLLSAGLAVGPVRRR